MTFSPSTQWTYRFHVHWVCYTSAFRTCVPLPAVVGCVRLGILYLDFEIPFLKFCSKTRNQKMDFNRSWWAPDFNSKKPFLRWNPIKKSKYEFHFHFIFHFYPCYWEIRKRDLQVQVRPRFFLENSFQILFLYFPEEKTGKNGSPTTDFSALKSVFRCLDFVIVSFANPK